MKTNNKQTIKNEQKSDNNKQQLTNKNSKNSKKM